MEPTLPLETRLTLPSLSFDDNDVFADLTPKLTPEEEDALLKVIRGWPMVVCSLVLINRHF